MTGGFLDIQFGSPIDKQGPLNGLILRGEMDRRLRPYGQATFRATVSRAPSESRTFITVAELKADVGELK